MPSASAAAAGRHPEHPEVAIRLNNLATTLYDLGRFGEALPLRERTLLISEKALGADHPDVASCPDGLAQTLRALDRSAEALPLQQRALAISEKPLGSEHPRTARIRRHLRATLDQEED